MPSTEGGLTVLAYHLVGGGTDTAVDLPLDLFRAQLDDLERCGQVVPLADGLATLEQGTTSDRHLIALTFDDAFGNFFAAAWPLLHERSLPAVLYVPLGFVEGTAPAPLTGAEELPPMSWDEIREVAASGLIELGSHTLTHPDLRRLPVSECRRELEQSRRRLVERSGQAVRSFCYPKALWSRPVKTQVAELYESAVVAGGRRNRPGLDLHQVQRLPLRRDMPASLRILLRSSIWLEEWAAAQARRWVT